MRHAFAFTCRRLQPGFSLFELLVAMVIVGILAAVALPSFNDSIRKGRRSDAVAHLSDVQQAQERYRSNNSEYAGSLDDLAVSVPATSHYTVSISNASARGYTATATARSTSSQASDHDCVQMMVRQTDGNIEYLSVSAGGTAIAAANNPCWAR